MSRAKKKKNRFTMMKMLLALAVFGTFGSLGILVGRSYPEQASPQHLENEAEDPPEEESEADQLAAEERLFLIKPVGPVHMRTYSVPGYYTVVLFSASWCTPCGKLRSHAPDWLNDYPNLVIVDLDISGDDSDALGDAESSILADLGESVTLPAALLINPYGLYMNRQLSPGIAPPVMGYEPIKDKMYNALPHRKHKHVLPIENKASLGYLQEQQEKRTHYSFEDNGRDEHKK